MIEQGKLERAIKGLECCIIRDPDDKPRCNDCPYDGACLNRLKWDAFDILIALEPRKPYLDFDGHDVWRCGSCGATIFHLEHTQADEDARNYAVYCRHCGRKVKWDD